MSQRDSIQQDPSSTGGEGPTREFRAVEAELVPSESPGLPDPQPPEVDPMGWTATDRRLLAIAGLMAALGLSLHWWRLGGFRELLEIERLPESASEYRLDVNQGTWVEWAQLDGIGETLGRRIVADREANGPFRSVEEVSRVPGIGPAKLDAIRRWLVVSEPEELPAVDPRPPAGK